MPRITYIDQFGTRHPIEVPNGMTVMQGAVAGGVTGFEGDHPGGCCACAKCHVYVLSDARGLFTAPDQTEIDVLRALSTQMANSRLSCRLTVDDRHDGLIVATSSGFDSS